jgi:transketolase
MRAAPRGSFGACLPLLFVDAMTATVLTIRSSAERRHLANAIRALAMDAVEQARSGHPGMPMGMADIAEVLWNDFLRHNPANPAWPDRDRFVLSNGHGSMLLYAVLHLSGYGLSIDDLRRFRQLGSHTAGHPERELHLGIETTTGPLGQGVANAVGMALAEKLSITILMCSSAMAASWKVFPMRHARWLARWVSAS